MFNLQTLHYQLEKAGIPIHGLSAVGTTENGLAEDVVIQFRSEATRQHVLILVLS